MPQLYFRLQSRSHTAVLTLSVLRWLRQALSNITTVINLWELTKFPAGIVITLLLNDLTLSVTQNTVTNIVSLQLIFSWSFSWCNMAYRCLDGTSPSYLAVSFLRTSDVYIRRRLRSADSATLVVHSTRRTTLGDRAFPVASARA